MPEPINFETRAFDAKGWPVDRQPVAHSTRQTEYPTVNRRLKGDRLPLPQNSPASSRPDSLPPLQPVNAPASRRPAPSVPPATPRPKSVEEIDSAPIGMRAATADIRWNDTISSSLFGPYPPISPSWSQTAGDALTPSPFNVLEPHGS